VPPLANVAPVGPVEAGPRAEELRRWLRPLGLVVLVVAVAIGVQVEPRPALSGPGLAVLLALAGMLVAGVALMLDLHARRLPPATLVVLFAVLIASSVTLVWLEPDGAGFFGGFLAAGMAAARLPRRRAVLAGLVLVALAVAGIAGAHRPIMSIVMTELGAVAFYRVGVYARRLRARTEQAEELLAELERSRAAQLQAATMAERQRLAREMHDVLAHSLSGQLLHLEAARLLAERDGAGPQLVDTLTRAHHLAQAGLGEARQAIGMLRNEDLPGPDRLAALAAEFTRDTGVDCRFTESGTPVELGSQVRLTLYRVAQEALTNIRKHACPERVELRLEHGAAGTGLTVEDFGPAGRPPPDPAGDDHGYGISGMRERAELLGGTLTAAPTGTGFVVALWVPA
jgi:signal transduction histidine kinase